MEAATVRDTVASVSRSFAGAEGPEFSCSVSTTSSLSTRYAVVLEDVAATAEETVFVALDKTDYNY